MSTRGFLLSGAHLNMNISSYRHGNSHYKDIRRSHDRLTFMNPQTWKDRLYTEMDPGQYAVQGWVLQTKVSPFRQFHNFSIVWTWQIKYVRDSKDQAYTFTKSQFSVTEKLTNGAWITPTPEWSSGHSSSHFPRYWPFVRGIHWMTLGFDVFFDLCLNSRLSNRDTGDLRRHRTPYDVIIMTLGWYRQLNSFDIDYKGPFVMHIQYCDCWCPGGVRRQVISIHALT